MTSSPAPSYFRRALAAGAAVIAILAAWQMLRPSSPELHGAHLPAPWEITLSPDGRDSSALGIDFARTTLGEFRQRLGGDLVVALIEQGDGRLAVEAFAARVDAGFISGALVLSTDLSADRLTAARQRARNPAPQPSGARRWTLAEDDHTAALLQPIASATFLPSVRLDEPMLESRFGVASERRTEEEPPRVHYLYPQRGLDVAIDGKGKTVLQYLRPADFSRLRAPLSTVPTAQ